MRLNQTIAAKLALAYILFLAPIGFLTYEMIADKQASIGFAQKEIAGLHYISLVRAVQDAAVRGGELAPLAAHITANQHAAGADFQTDAAAAALVKSLNVGDRAGAAQAAADLISKAADGSNLTLDPDLDSFYTQDAVTVKIPAAIAGIAGLVDTIASTAGHSISVADQVNIGVQTGALQPTLDGLTADIGSAVAGNPDKTVDAAVTAAVAKVGETARPVLADLANHAKAANAHAIAQPLLEAISKASTADQAELEHLLNARIAGFRAAELINGAIAATLFFAAVSYVLIVVQRGAIGPLRVLSAALRRIAANDLNTTIAGLDRTDEVGEMARAVELLRSARVQAEAQAAASLQAQHSRDRHQAAIDHHTQDFGHAISGVMEELGQCATDMRLAADQMSGAAQQTQTTTANACAGANMSARDLNAVAVASEQLSSSIQEISGQIRRVTQAVHDAVHRASETDTKVAGLATAADRIGDVVRLISDIAGQTNLLALNATIEAARAGEAGKGFAVVASEVKALAMQSARATEQIGGQIIAIRQATGDAVEAVRGVGQAIAQVEEVATAIANAVEQQAEATQEISRNVQNVTVATSASLQSMDDVLSIARQTSDTSATVLTAAEAVGRTTTNLRGEVTDFLAAIKPNEGQDRRAYQRFPGGGAIASVFIDGAEQRAVVRDMSRGGIGLACDAGASPGTEIRVKLASGENICGRIARAEPGLLTIAFRQDTANVALVDRALDSIRAQSTALAS